MFFFNVLSLRNAKSYAGEKMYKKVIFALLLGFLVIGAASAADFIINDGFENVNEYYSIDEDNSMYLYTWNYDDELMQEAYLQNDTDYRIVSGDNNTYNVSYSTDISADLISYLNNSEISLDYGVLEVAEVNGVKYIFMVYKENGSKDDWKICYDELMKFNENNNIEPLADAI